MGDGAAGEVDGEGAAGDVTGGGDVAVLDSEGVARDATDDGAAGRCEDPVARQDANPAAHPLRGPSPGAFHETVWLTVRSHCLLHALSCPTSRTQLQTRETPLNAVDDNAPCIPEVCAPAGNASAFDPAWAAANGPASPPGTTPLIMAIASSRSAGCDP